MRNAVNVSGRMWNRMKMVSMSNQVRMRRRMRDVMEMGIGNKALCICKLSHSKNCDGGHYECARFQHFILPKGC
jgi:hypothetical protein